jgi:hypothetical protein
MRPKPFPLFKSAFTLSRRSSHAFPVFPLSIVEGVGHPTMCVATAVSVSAVPRPQRIPELSESSDLGVGQPDKVGALADVSAAMLSPKVSSSEVGKSTQRPGHHGIGAKVYGPGKSFAPDAFFEGFQASARSAQIGRPKGVSLCFQVSRYMIEPHHGILACNLLAKDDCRATLLDEPVPVRPEVPLVVKPIALACRAERLAGARSGPDGAIVSPSGRAEGEGPHSDSGEEMALSKSSKLVWGDVTD